MRVLLVKVNGEPTHEESEAIVNDFKELAGSDVVLVIGDGRTADAVWDTLEGSSRLGWRSLPPANQGLIRQLLKDPPGPGQKILERYEGRTITCDKPQGPPVKLMGDQAEGIHPPFAGTYQREARGVSMGCEIAPTICSICAAKVSDDGQE